ncbi:kappa-type opioid receptor-like [Apostichopus japonicus]
MADFDDYNYNETITSTEDNIFQWSPIAWYWWIISQTCLSVIGLIGNTIVIYIYTFKIRQFSSMNRLIRGLAVADLCTSAFLSPIPLIARVPSSPLGHIYCKVIYPNNLMWISIVASVYTLTMMSIEQCLAVLYPLKNRFMFSKSRSKIILLMVWIASFLTNAFTYFASYRSEETGECTFDLGGRVTQSSIGVFIFSLEYFIPMTIMVATHVATLHCLRKQAVALMDHVGSRSDEKTRRDSIMLRAHQRVLKMLFVVVLTFIICWTADQVSFFLFNIGILERQFLFSNVYHAFVILAFVNSCANPFIYTASNPQFRRALRTFWDAQESSSGNSIGKVEIHGRNSTAFTAATTIDLPRVPLNNAGASI